MVWFMLAIPKTGIIDTDPIAARVREILDERSSGTGSAAELWAVQRKRRIGLARSTATAAYLRAGEWRQAADRHHRLGPYRWRDWRLVG